jgi:hypothetical protein
VQLRPGSHRDKQEDWPLDQNLDDQLPMESGNASRIVEKIFAGQPFEVIEGRALF